MLDAIFWLEIIIYEVFTNVQKKSVVLEPVINSYQFPIVSGMNFVNVTVAKIVVSSSQ